MATSLADWLQRIEQLHPRSVDMGLDRVRAVQERLGLPRPAPCVITVGGTNGKGSTVAFIEAMTRSAGLRVGAYTSPHLRRYNERVRIDGADVGDDAFVEAFEAIDAARGDTTLTYFEYGTLAALWLFARAGLDVALLEVGLGGRLDATNIIDADVSVITTVDLDHQDYLGDDVESIGFEKAGIARAWKPLVLGDDDPPSSVLRHAYAIGAHALRIGCDFFIEEVDAQTWRWREVGFEVELPMPQLDAPAQRRNAAVAIAAVRAAGLEVGEAAMRAGVASAHVPGRLQRVLRDGLEYVVDVGHNPQAAGQLAGWLRTHATGGGVHAVFAALGDKDAAGVVRSVGDAVDHWNIAGLADHAPRGVDVDTFASRLAGTVAGDAARWATVADALVAVSAQATAGDRVLVFGSFHTAAEALDWLRA